tara:strand:+ start:73 stop:330 length:258 start_codon:yes stop_codon:yes gene_type:complete
MWDDILKIEPYERAVAEEFAEPEDLKNVIEQQLDKFILDMKAAMRNFSSIGRMPETILDLLDTASASSFRKKRQIVYQVLEIITE